MGVFDIFSRNKALTTDDIKAVVEQTLASREESVQLSAEDYRSHADTGYPGNYGGGMTPMFTIGFNGEKNLGEMGPVKNFILDYPSLRARSWQAYLESLTFKTIVDKLTIWIVPNGLKLQSQPVASVLKSEGINIDTEAFNEVTETRFEVHANSTESSYDGMQTLHQLATTSFRDSVLGGDTLVVMRYDGSWNTQLIDGVHVQSPTVGTDWFPLLMADGHKLIHGIEMDARGRHIRYYVRQRDFSFVTIEGYSKTTGLRMAWLDYGDAYRIDNHRGIPVLAVALEMCKKLERYTEATIGTAEELSKITYQIVHEQFSTGEHPGVQAIAKATSYGSGVNAGLPRDVQGRELANKVQATTNKATYNMPIGSEIKGIQSDNRVLEFKDFSNTIINWLCAAMCIPPNVAMSMYNDSFSASRAAIEDFQHTIIVKRKKRKDNFYYNHYVAWLHTEILSGKISAPGYLLAYAQNNTMVLNAYRTCIFTASRFPHIDPLKEVMAARAKLGPKAANIPFSTVQDATQNLNGGESQQNMAQFAVELETAEELGFGPDPAAEEVEKKDFKETE